MIFHFGKRCHFLPASEATPYATSFFLPVDAGGHPRICGHPPLHVGSTSDGVALKTVLISPFPCKNSNTIDEAEQSVHIGLQSDKLQKGKTMLKKTILTSAILTLLLPFAAQAEESTATPPSNSTALLGLLQKQGIANKSTLDALSPHLNLLEKQLPGDGQTSKGKLDDLLHSEKGEKLKELFSRTVVHARDTGGALDDRLADTLKLSKEQMTKVKPALSEGLTDLRTATGEAIDSGKVRWVEFQPEYDAIVSKMRNQVKESLNSEQMKTFDTFVKNKGKSIQKTLQ